MSEKARVLVLLKRYGWNATSFQVLEPGLAYWFSEAGDAAVAYVETGSHWVAAGAPICDAARLGEVAASFAAAARRAHRRAAFFGAAARLLQAAPAFDWLQVGIQPWWDPRAWSASSSVAAQVRRAGRKGVVVREADAAEFTEGMPLRRDAEALVARWLARHPMAPMQFMVDLDAFSNAGERRYYVATVGDALAGLLVAVPIYARNGWFLEDLVTDRAAPNGTSETLIEAALRSLARDGVEYATMGLAALAGLGGGEGRHRLLTALLRRSYESLNWLYGFRGVHAFRVRLKPTGAEPIYLMSDGPVTVFTVLAVLEAFAGGRPDRFAAETARKFLERVTRERWAAASSFLAIALVPWIGMLLASDGARWFGAAWLAGAWASFDVAVAVAFARLAKAIREARGWGRPLARILLGVVLADGWMTAMQAILYNLPRIGSPLEGLLVAVGVAAPLSAAGYLALLLAAGPPFKNP